MLPNHYPTKHNITANTPPQPTMSTFLSNLWDSVFTPGTTPTLLIATNATFALLQLLLLALLVATWSVHFAILSVLCGGLWWSINWFATELQAAQAKEEEAEKLRRRKKKSDGGNEADDEGEETEVDEKGGEEEGRVKREIEEAMGMEDKAGMDGKQGPASDGGSTGVATGMEQKDAQAKQRRVEELDRSGDVSTDSEWERVSQEGDQ